MSIGEVQLTPVRPHQALLLEGEGERVLVIADLHIGWEVSLAEGGVHVPSQTPKLIKRLIEMIRTEEPDRLLILGDVKHTIAKIEMEEWRDVPKFFEHIQSYIGDVEVIPGNHDGNLEPLLPEFVKIGPPRGVAVGDVGLFHGHTWPDPKLLGCRTLVIGHVHPVVALRDPIGFRITKQVWVRADCDSERLARLVLRNIGVKVRGDPGSSLRENYNVELKASKLIIMPSFNDFLGGQAVNRRSMGRKSVFKDFIGPVLRSGSVRIDEAEVYMLDGTYLGTVNHLRTLV